METIGCIFCRGNESDDRVVIDENGFAGKKCQNCGLIYISPRPALLEITNLYASNEAHISAAAHINASFRKRLLARHSLSILKRYGKKGSLLELGSGAGYFLDEARKIGFDVYGIELNQIQAEFIKRNLNIPCETTALASSYGSRKFDIIYHSDVLSHFYNPISEFKGMNNRLNDGGLMIFETGNLGDVKDKYYSMFTKFQYPDHLFFFGEENLKHLLRITGFELIAIYKYSILCELKIRRFLGKLKGMKNGLRRIDKGNKGRNNNEKACDFSNMSRRSHSDMMKKLKNISYVFFYFLNYRLGYVVPKKGRPQTDIVVARKISVTS